jgi:hypothetical protein
MIVAVWNVASFRYPPLFRILPKPSSSDPSDLSDQTKYQKMHVFKRTI